MKIFFIVFFIFFSNLIYALNINDAEISGEEINGCNLSKEYSNASISTALRQNRILIVNKNAVFTFYHQITAIETSQSNCAVHINFLVNIYDYHQIPVKPPKKLFLSTPICSLGTLLTGPKYDMQTRVSDDLRKMTERCINEIIQM